jgi:hypothetical protein
MSWLKLMKSSHLILARSSLAKALLCMVFFAPWRCALATHVLLIDASPVESPARRQLELASRFYGLDLEVADGGAQPTSTRLLEAIRNPKTLAVVVTANTLARLSRGKVLAALERPNHGHIPLLIIGIDDQTSTETLTSWSGDAISGSQRAEFPQEGAWYAIAPGNNITVQLGGSNLPLAAKSLPYLTLHGSRTAQWLVAARRGNDQFPVFAMTGIDGQNIFFATNVLSPDVPASPDPYRQQAVFASMAPSLLFLRYAAGDYAWHSKASYANFTIDDIWLREPYGHVNYEQLLEQAQQHNFHVTAAFIPWNFDRSQPKLVSLFRSHSDRLSICIHGNNHVHQEFGPLATHPIERQRLDLELALARMNKFTEITGIPYDAVMVFPHSVAPEATFAALRQFGYLATANSLSVPSDAAAPEGADFALRAATLRFADFPSLRRYSVEAEIAPAQLAIDAFLGNPMLFYAHESFFESGTDAFNRTADAVNALEPTTQWRGLGDIARHLYLERLRDDGNYDIRAYSRTVQIQNRSGNDATFFIEKDEDFAQPLAVKVDGDLYPFDRRGTQLALHLSIRRGETREITISQQNGVALANIDISKKSLHINAIRLLSDFRDNTVSNTEMGRRFIRSYAGNGTAWNLAMMAMAALIALAAFLWYARRSNRQSPKNSSPLQFGRLSR